MEQAQNLFQVLTQDHELIKKILNSSVKEEDAFDETKNISDDFDKEKEFLEKAFKEIKSNLDQFSITIKETFTKKNKECFDYGDFESIVEKFKALIDDIKENVIPKISNNRNEKIYTDLPAEIENRQKENLINLNEDYLKHDNNSANIKSSFYFSLSSLKNFSSLVNFISKCLAEKIKNAEIATETQAFEFSNQLNDDFIKNIEKLEKYVADKNNIEYKNHAALLISSYHKLLREFKELNQKFNSKCKEKNAYNNENYEEIHKNCYDKEEINKLIDDVIEDAVLKTRLEYKKQKEELEIKNKRLESLQENS